MKRFRVILIFSIVISVHCSVVTEYMSRDGEIEVKWVDSLIKIDGQLNEPFWKNSESIFLRDNKTGKDVTDSLGNTIVMTGYDSNNIYFAFICYDTDIWSTFTERDQRLWQEEVVEIFISWQKDRTSYLEIDVSPNNVLFDSYIIGHRGEKGISGHAYNLPDIKTAVLIDGTLNVRDDRDNKWVVEIAIPFSGLIANYDLARIKELPWHVNFYRIDRNNNERYTYSWQPTGGNFHKPSKFGKLRFN